MSGYSRRRVIRGIIGQVEAMTTHEAAALLGVSDRTARRLAPELGARRVGRAWLLDRAAVLEHAEGATP